MFLYAFETLKQQVFMLIAPVVSPRFIAMVRTKEHDRFLCREDHRVSRYEARKPGSKEQIDDMAFNSACVLIYLSNNINYPIP